MRHNIRDFEANLLKQVCNDVESESPLQLLDVGDEARPDVRARGFWRNGQNAFFDIVVTNTNCVSQSSMSASKIYAKHEAIKKRSYNQRIMQVEHGTFTPLVFSVNGGVGPECERFHKHIAEKIAEKTGESYGYVISWIRCKLSFLILRAALICIRGSRPHSAKNASEPTSDFALACGDARLAP